MATARSDAGSDDDPVARLVERWRQLRPDLEFDPMASFIRLGRFHDLATRSIEDTFAAHGLNIGEFDVLASLLRADPPHELTPTALTRLIALSPAGMTNRIDRLEAAGLVERRADPDDRRSSKVRLTDLGRERVEAAVGDHVANEARLLGALTDAERRQLDRLMSKLLADLEAG